MDPWWPVSCAWVGSTSRCITPTGSNAAATTSPIRGRTHGWTCGPNQPASTASSPVTTHMLEPSSARQAVSTSSAAPGFAWT